MPEEQGWYTIGDMVTHQIAEELALFLRLNMSPLNPELGQFLQSRFDPEAIKFYWKKLMGRNIVGTVGMGWVLRDYLNQGNPLEWLRDVYPLPDDECGDDYNGAVKKLTTKLLEMGITDSDRVEDVTEINNPENPESETVWSMLEKFTCAMKGAPSQLSITMKTESFRAEMIETFQRKDPVEAAIDEFNEEVRLAEEQHGDKRRRIISRIESEAENEGYEISTFDDLIHWDAEKSLHPGIAKALEALYEGRATQVPKIREVFSQSFDADSLKGRMKILLESNRKFLISKDAWDFIRSKIGNDDHYYLIENQSITIFEIRPMFMNPKEKQEEDIAKTTYVKSSDNWKIFWMKRDLKWHGYEPDPVVESLEEFLSIVGEDAYCCFWG